jgi:hypothetical protein
LYAIAVKTTHREMLASAMAVTNRSFAARDLGKQPVRIAAKVRKWP